MIQRSLNINWDDPKGLMFFNPKTSQAEQAHVTQALSSLPEGQSCFWVSTSGSTSGATAESKWVALSKSAIFASAQAVNAHLNASSNDSWIHVLPEFHVGGLGILARAQLCGAQVIEGLKQTETGAKWDAQTFYQVCTDSRSTLTALVPAQVHDLVSKNLPAPPMLRAVVVGGGALSLKLYDQASALGWPLLPSYGMSECSSQIATAFPGNPELHLLSHIEAKNTSDGHLLLRSPALFSGYGFVSDGGARWADPKHAGWFKTEDRAQVDTENRIQIHGRSEDFLKIGGESVELPALEAVLELVLNQLRDARSARLEGALFPIPDARLGCVIHAVISADDSNLAQIAFQSFNQRVLPFERARNFHFTHSPLPRSPLGKLLRGQLPNLFQLSEPKGEPS